MQSTIEVADKKWKHFDYPEFSGYPTSTECPKDWIEDNQISESNWNVYLISHFQDVFNPSLRAPALSVDETREMFIRFNYCKKMISLGYDGWKTAWQSVRCKIFYANMGLIGAAIRMTKGTLRSDHCDLIHEGGIALLRSIDSFNISKGYQFSTYGIVSIRHAVNKFVDLRNRNAIRFRSCDYNFSNTISLDSDSTDKILLRSAIGDLEPNEVDILKLRFDLDLNVSEIGIKLGISRARAHSLLKRTIQKLMRLMKCS